MSKDQTSSTLKTCRGTIYDLYPLDGAEDGVGDEDGVLRRTADWDEDLASIQDGWGVGDSAKQDDWDDSDG